MPTEYWAGPPLRLGPSAYARSVDAWPLVGRRVELAQLTAAVVARRGAVITGSPGVGKTTLALTGVEVSHERGLSLARTTATRASRRLPVHGSAGVDTGKAVRHQTS